MKISSPDLDHLKVISMWYLPLMWESTGHYSFFFLELEWIWMTKLSELECIWLYKHWCRLMCTFNMHSLSFFPYLCKYLYQILFWSITKMLCDRGKPSLSMSSLSILFTFFHFIHPFLFGVLAISLEVLFRQEGSWVDCVVFIFSTVNWEK